MGTGDRDPETIVLVPGLMCTRALFAPQIAMLEKAGHTVLVADHTGDASIAGIVERLLANSPPVFGLVGLSMGGYIALETMRRAPDRVSRLALLDTSARADTREQSIRRRELVAQSRTPDGFARGMATLWPLLVHETRREDAALRAVVNSMARTLGPEVLARQEEAITGRADSRPSLARIEVPTLVLVGDGDALTPPEMSREIGEAIEWSSLTIVPECGHLSTLERPEAVNRAFQAWLATS